jgi:hypothetical protein
LGYYEDVHQPLAPPPGASSERLLTTSTAASGNVNRVTCEGAGGVYTEHCPSMAQIGVVGPAPAGTPTPCVAYCEMPSGQQTSTQEDPYNRWQPTMPGMTGDAAYYDSLDKRYVGIRGFGADAASSGGFSFVGLLALGLVMYLISVEVVEGRRTRR